MHKFTHFLIFVLLSGNAMAANWTVSRDDSTINFVTIKNNDIAETHRFNDFVGQITDGEASIVIRPDSVDTRVPIRDERMREFLFNTAAYPTIDVKANVAEPLAEVLVGDSKTATIQAQIGMHGNSKEMPINVRISRMSDNKLIVSTTDPILVRAQNFDMVDGILKLSSLVNGLPIVETVPVSFSLVLMREEKAPTT